MSTAPTPRQIQNQGQVPAGLARLAALTMVAACLALGAGCSRGSATSSYSPTWTPPATTTASGTPTLSPELAAARATALAMEPPNPYTPQFTPEGAAEAATYFLNLVPYVYATGDLDAWKNMSKDDCKFCNGVGTEASELHDAGGWTDPWEQEITPLDYWTDENDPNRYVIRTNVTTETHASHLDGQTTRQIEKAEHVLLIQTYWTNSNWTIEIVQVEDEEGAE
ncbi:DUF6318 family protein [Actinomyces qiguomingii]|uniref:DUF6318 family protein n=1 Tax=Actinomyces qiguomingii TaxID=2057800 RepID=UPI000CA00727|nr:DUF6318 family protein [Actinomyces qiguomingii]